MNLERMWTAVFVVYSVYLFKNFPMETEENH